MRTLFTGLIAAAILSTGMGVVAPTPAAAQSVNIEVSPRGVQVIRDRGGRVAFERYCARNPRDRDCREFRRDERRDDRRGRDYRRGDRREDVRPGRVSRASVARCAQRYRSYDPRTHTYVINNRGDRAVCRL